jgi:hypothetical protein
MGQIPRKPQYPITLESVYSYLELMGNVLAHKISFGSTFGNTAVDNNMDSYMVDVASSAVAANTEFSVSHNLTRIPIFFISITRDGSVLYSFYGGMTAWTAATSAGNDGKIYLKSTGANTGFKIIIF